MLNIPHQTQLRRDLAHGRDDIAHMLPNIHAEDLRGMFHFGTVCAGGEGFVLPFLFNPGRFKIL